MAANALRAALSELGIVAAQGYEGLRELMARLEEPSEEIPENMRGALLLLAGSGRRSMPMNACWNGRSPRRADVIEDARRLMEVPGVGPIIASTVLAKVPRREAVPLWPRLCGLDRTYRQGPWHGRQASPGAYLQTGGSRAASAADQRCQRPSATAEGARRHRSVAARSAGSAALQGRHGGLSPPKTARIIWAMLVKGEAYRDPRERVGCCLAGGRQPARSRSLPIGRAIKV